MGAEPEFFLLSIAVPPERGEEVPLGIVRGAIARAAAHGATLAGGDLSAAPLLVVSIAFWGRPAGDPLTRSGASPGDLVYVSGHPGEAAAGLRLGRGGAAGCFPSSRPPTGSASSPPFATPSPASPSGPGSGASASPRPRSMSPTVSASTPAVSRGPRACASRLERERLPISPALAAFAAAAGVDPIELAVGGGDDYELLFTVREADAPRLARKGRRSRGSDPRDRTRELGKRRRAVRRARRARHRVSRPRPLRGRAMTDVVVPPEPGTEPRKRRLSLRRRSLKLLLDLMGRQESPERVAAAVALGVGIGLSPFIGFHFLLAIVLASLFRLSRLDTVLGSLVGKPLDAAALLRRRLPGGTGAPRLQHDSRPAAPVGAHPAPGLLDLLPRARVPAAPGVVSSGHDAARGHPRARGVLDHARRSPPLPSPPSPGRREGRASAGTRRPAEARARNDA